MHVFLLLFGASAQDSPFAFVVVNLVHRCVFLCLWRALPPKFVLEILPFLLKRLSLPIVAFVFPFASMNLSVQFFT